MMRGDRDGKSSYRDPCAHSARRQPKTTEDNPMKAANINLAKLATAIALTACAGIAHARQVQEVIRVTVYKMAEKPSNTVTTRAEPQQFGRDSVYATQPPNPGNPVLAGGLTVDEGGGAPVYATQLTHPSGPVMEAGNDFQPYGRDSVYVAGSPSAHAAIPCRPPVKPWPGFKTKTRGEIGFADACQRPARSRQSAACSYTHDYALSLSTSSASVGNRPTGKVPVCRCRRHRCRV